eukprot:m.55081 g.55081  ORF g.55081 m.55081 type:complete len:178 (+) comp7579_c0_seq3:508-1041(+)
MDSVHDDVEPYVSDVMDFFNHVVSGDDDSDASGVHAPSPTAGTNIPRAQSGGGAGKVGGMAGASSMMSAAARKRKRTKMSAEEEAAEAEMKKLKSVQSARDCRRRKKAFIQSLQVRVKECEDREVATQARIAALEVELKQLQAARGDLHPTSQAEATIIETLNASDEMGANLNEILG